MAKINTALAVLLFIVSVAWCQPTSVPVNQTSPPVQSTTSTTVPPSIPEKYEYIVKLLFGLENEKIPEFIVKAIYDANFATPADLIMLYDVGNISLAQTVEVLQKLKYDPSNVLSMKGLETILDDLNVKFKNFYNTIFLEKLNISGVQLRNFLQALNINTAEFSEAMTYGDEDPLVIFKKGNFSSANFQKALNTINETEEKFYSVCRQEIFQIVITQNSTSDVLSNLKKYHFDQREALQLWKIMNVTEENVESVPVFADLLTSLEDSLKDTTYLGVITSNTQVGINEAVYDDIKDKLKMAKLYAQSIYNNNNTVALVPEKSEFTDLVTFKVQNHNFTEHAQIATTKKDLTNCLFVTVNNGTVISTKVDVARYRDSEIKVELNLTQLIQGSPLICDKKVYGLAKEIDEGDIVFDTFNVDSDKSSVSTNVLSTCLAILCFVVYFKI
ncbi:uncharacterized protein LOC114332837 [Diabrotica virgifera virgifera]|uniref:Uncharacterized protein LOC114332837 isoform X1 n=1 Tax=Diabrotica virgifera virgifera TaxID=50390 RepID=A0A6P7FUD7_DIAVI|nr:uncharacterized protein LOC114332837 [Diabrotica virgifera virgifera]XP_028138416.1 uncharacterized protein LOC114332837 [Diabrotica virgifera virgifera]XP_028138417.1 uncharacterized protein LOC114332837 [Diabrotica virgifera virgifera]